MTYITFQATDTTQVDYLLALAKKKKVIVFLHGQEKKVESMCTWYKKTKNVNFGLNQQ